MQVSKKSIPPVKNSIRMRDEAAVYEPVDSEDKNHTIINVVQKGYNLNGRPMRPAKVKVGEFKP